MTAVALALGGVLLAIAIGFVMLRLARGGDVQVRLGSDTWNVGKASRLAPAIAEGGPMMFSDVAGGSRDLYVSHTGDDAQRVHPGLATYSGRNSVSLSSTTAPEQPSPSKERASSSSR
jgi:hypothetical protein